MKKTPVKAKFARTPIAFFDAKDYDRQFFDAANRIYGYDIRYYADKLNLDRVPQTAEAEIVCAFVNDDLSAPVIKRLAGHGVKLLAMRCAGYNNIDLEAAAANGIRITRVPAYSPHAVAEYAVAMLLTLNRKTHRAYFRVRDNNFSISGLLGFDLCGKTVGVIGTGKIGCIFAKLMLGFGMKVLAFDPFPDKELAALGVKYATLDEIYAGSRVISLHCPLTRENHHLINSDALRKMQQGVVLINTSRGALVDSTALVRYLKNGKVGGAALDVYEEEDAYFFEDFSNRIMRDDTLARLASFNNVLVTSHQGFFTTEALTNIAESTLHSIREYLSGKKLTCEVCARCGR